MSRPRKKIPTYTHHKPSGQARVRIDGRDHYLGPFNSPESLEKYRRLLAGSGAPGPPSEGPATVGGLVSRFLAEAKTTYAPASREPAQFRQSLRPLLALYGSMPAAEFGPEHLEVLLVAMAQGNWTSQITTGQANGCAQNEPKNRRCDVKGWCCNVVNRRAVRVRTLFRWAERRRLVPAGTWATLCTVPLLSARSHLVRHTRPPEPTELRDVVRVARHLPPPAAAMLLVQWWSGMRSCEVRAMRTADLDTTDSRAWVYTVPAHADKTYGHADGRRRVVVLGPKAIALVRRWLRGDRPDLPLFRPPAARHGADGWRYRDTGYSGFGYAQAVRRASLAVGVKVLAYGGRHATRLRVTRADGLDAARAILGHRSLGITARYAQGQDLELAKRAAKKVG